MEQVERRSFPLNLEVVKWAAVRLGVKAYMVFGFFSLVGCYLTAPLVSYIFLNDWRFWRYLKMAPSLQLFAWKGAWRILKGENHGFLFAVPLTDPPTTFPDPNQVQLKESWPHGLACADCTRCCDVIGCPFVDHEQHLCIGFDSLYWRYFNCGRFPTCRDSLEYYQCPKWELKSCSKKH